MYPKEFSRQHQAKIEAEKIRAAGRLSNSRRSTAAIGSGSTMDDVRSLLRRYVLDVFSEFASIACELGRQGAWSAVEVEKQAWKFVLDLASETDRELGYDRNGNLVGLTDYNQRLLANQDHLIRESMEWAIFQSQRLEVATLQAAPPSPQQSTPEPKAIGELLDEIIVTGALSHEQLAHKIGISRTAYFDVKAGRGGKKAKARIRLYLSNR